MFKKKNNIPDKFNKQRAKEKTILSNYVYNKFITRSYLMGNKKFAVLDNSSHFYNISATDLKKVSVYSKTEEVGVSLSANLTQYSNKYNNSLRFKSFNFNNKINSFSALNSFTNLLEVITNDSSNSLIFLNPIKGGFTCYSSGVVGFLPRKQADFLVSIASNSLKDHADEKSFLTDVNYFFNHKYFLRNFL